MDNYTSIMLVLAAAISIAFMPLYDAIIPDWNRVWRKAWFRVGLIKLHGQYIFDIRYYWQDHHFAYTRMWWPRGVVWSSLSSK